MGLILAPNLVSSSRGYAVAANSTTVRFLPVSASVVPGARCALASKQEYQAIVSPAEVPANNGTFMRVSGLWVYPVKSMRGSRVASATVAAEGLVGDRRVMVATFGGQLVTQRQQPRLATVDARIEAGGRQLVLSAPGRAPITIGLVDGEATQKASVWSYPLELVDLGTSAAAWLSRTLGGGGSILPLLGVSSYRLLYAPRPTGRQEVLSPDLSLPAAH